jgi:dTDP-4-amino-4,6-dideoxygalactose transaminase
MGKRITIAPFLKITNFYKLLFYKTLDDNNLAKAWTKNDQYPFWLSRSAWSIKLIVLTYATTCKSKNFNNINIWVPEYFCNSSLDLIRELGANLIFYRITENGEPDIDWCNKNSYQNKPNIFIVVHYFGIPIDLSFVISFCKLHHCWLIEDAAHVLKKSNNIGNHGDFIIYSPHKLLAIPNGAVLIYNSSGISYLNKSCDLLNILRSEYIDLLKTQTKKNYHLSIYFWIFKRLLQGLGFRSKYVYKSVWPEIENLDRGYINPKMNYISKKLLTIELLFLDQYTTQRKSNFNLLKSYLLKDDISNLITFPRIDNYDPYVLSLNINQNDIEYVNKYLTDKKLPILTWPDLPPEIFANDKSYSISVFLRKSILHIPIHQCITSEEIKACFKN